MRRTKREVEKTSAMSCEHVHPIKNQLTNYPHKRGKLCLEPREEPRRGRRVRKHGLGIRYQRPQLGPSGNQDFPSLYLPNPTSRKLGLYVLVWWTCGCFAQAVSAASASSFPGFGFESALTTKVIISLTKMPHGIRHYNFGVEIEAVTRPYGNCDSFTNVDWYRQLAQKLRNRGIQAVHDDCSKYSKHPEYYGGKWFVTRDGSLKRPRPYVCMEVVSPKLDTMRGVSPIISDFWEAMRVHFKPQEDVSCGGHVHVTPVNLKNKFSLRTLKKIAFATVVYEDYVAEILPTARRDNHYCRLNSQSLDSGLNKTLGWGKTVGTLRKVAAEIRSQSTKADLCHYMQGNRYVLWNFQNIYPHRRRRRCTGTIEFRGGNQFLNTKGTLAWVAFVLGFITLAKEEDLLNNFCSYVPPTDPSWPRRVKDWWKRIREAAKQSRMSRHLPATYTEMQTK